MSKIFGVEVKNVRNAVDHEGFQIHAGNIYMDGKKIGSWSDSYMAGSNEYDIPDKEYEALVERANQFYAIYKWDDGKVERDGSLFKGDPDILISKIIELNTQEKEFKKCLKKDPAYKSMIIVSGPYGMYSCWYIPGIHEDWEIKYADQIAKSVKQFPAWSNPKVKYITGMDSFVVDSTATSFVW